MGLFLVRAISEMVGALLRRPFLQNLVLDVLYSAHHSPDAAFVRHQFAFVQPVMYERSMFSLGGY